MDTFPRDLSRDSVVAQGAARAAGAYLVQRLGLAQGQKSKAARDTQLDVDLGAEKLVLNALHEAFPDDAILSEEGDSPPSTASRLWIIDPLDGSFSTRTRCSASQSRCSSMGSRRWASSICRPAMRCTVPSGAKAHSAMGSQFIRRPPRISARRSSMSPTLHSLVARATTSSVSW